MSAEAHLAFPCFGGTAAIHVHGGSASEGQEAAAHGREKLLDAHRRLTRFSEDSELSRFNADPREVVPASPLLCRLAGAVLGAGRTSGGLVDATLLAQIRRAGYAESLDGPAPVSLREALERQPERAPARPREEAAWKSIRADAAAGTVRRPPGVGIDSGGIAKGMLADLLAAELSGARQFAVDCCGDVRVGGIDDRPRRILVDDPFGGGTLHELSLARGAAATSGIGRRCWIGSDGLPAHHILDPASGTPAFTGVVQATAVAPTALLAEIYAKAALLSGTERAAEWLPYGGVLVLDDGSAQILGATAATPVAA